MFFSSSHFITPDAASSPNALPPASEIALTIWTLFTGFSRSVSRVPGAPPRTSTPPVVPSLKRIAVHPVGRSLSVTLPTLTPSTAVSVMLSAAGFANAAAFGSAVAVDCAVRPLLAASAMSARNAAFWAMSSFSPQVRRSNGFYSA